MTGGASPLSLAELSDLLDRLDRDAQQRRRAFVAHRLLSRLDGPGEVESAQLGRLDPALGRLDPALDRRDHRG